MSGDRAVRRPRLDGRLRRIVFWRSLTLQASWNGQRMQNLGLLAVMLPWLVRRPRDLTADRLFCRRYYEFFNTNPYLANYLIGGLLRLEDDADRGVTGGPTPSVFRDSLGRAFASLGDQFFWMGLRPALTMGLCLLALAGQSQAVILVVCAFAALQLALRWVSLGRGYALGLDLVDLLGDARWHRWIGVARRATGLAIGLVAGAYLARLAAPDLVGGKALPWLGLALGWALPALLRRRLPGEGLLVLAALLALVLAFAI